MNWRTMVMIGYGAAILGLLAFVAWRVGGSGGILDRAYEIPSDPPKRRAPPPDFALLPYRTAGNAVVLSLWLLDPDGSGVPIAWVRANRIYVRKVRPLDGDLHYARRLVRRSELEALLTYVVTSPSGDAAESAEWVAQGKERRVTRRVAMEKALDALNRLLPMPPADRRPHVLPAMRIKAVRSDQSTPATPWPIRRVRLAACLEPQGRLVTDSYVIGHIQRKVSLRGTFSDRGVTYDVCCRPLLADRSPEKGDD